MNDPELIKQQLAEANMAIAPAELAALRAVAEAAEVFISDVAKRSRQGRWDSGPKLNSALAKLKGVQND
jgi:hypothetical protein